MPIRTRRWCDPAKKGDGLRLLICRYRPRGVRKEDETWDQWRPNLGPSRELHADYYGKLGPPISWKEYVRGYLREMATQRQAISELAALVRQGKTVTLLCSSACTDERHCHRRLLKELIEKELSRAEASPGAPRRSADCK